MPKGTQDIGKRKDREMKIEINKEKLQNIASWINSVETEKKDTAKKYGQASGAYGYVSGYRDGIIAALDEVGIDLNEFGIDLWSKIFETLYE